MSFFICPVCRNNLLSEEQSLKCNRGHNFDRAKSGYYNLLLSNVKNHGDDRSMVSARSDFLDRGFYLPLLQQLSEIVKKHYKSGIILDAGCGEGYYTQGLYQSLKRSEITADIIAVDISKIAIEKAAKRGGAKEYAVASVYDLPIRDSSAEIVLNVFAPFSTNEFKRILKKNGILIYVIPLEHHLFGLKKIVYEKPYVNVIKPYEADTFVILDVDDLKYRILLETNEDIRNLFMMTPYYYTTCETDQDKIKKADFLETEAEFRIITYKRLP